MGIFPTLISSRQYGPEHDYWYNPVPFPTSSGVPVTEKEALKYLTVFACVTLISGDVGRLPLNMYRRNEDGSKDLIIDHKLSDLLHNAPNDEMTSFNWREASQGHLLLWGNHYDVIVRGKANAIQALWPIPDPGQVRVYRKGKKIVYEYKDADGKTVVKGREDIFHIPGYGFNGLYGLSMIGAAREAIGLGVSAEQFGSRYFGEGTHPSGIMTVGADLGESKDDYIKALKTSYAGLGKTHTVMVLGNEEKYQALTVPLDDAQFLETRNYQKVEICGMYHVPPHKIAIHGQNSNYNNLEQENASYVDSCLMHWITRWESNISLQLLTEQERRSGLFFEFQVQGLLRGDSKARAEFYNKIFQVGGIKPNEIRSFENMNPVEGGDEAFIMLNMVPLKDAGKEMVLPGDIEPGPEQEPETETEKEVKASTLFFSEDRAKELMEIRSIRMRDRLAKAYRYLILDAARAVVSRETRAIKKQLAGRQTRAAAEPMGDFLNEFYAAFPEYIERKMGPALRSYMQAVIEESIAEIGGDKINLDVEIKEYIEGYAQRHVDGSLGQMTALLEGDLADLETRADEWQEKRPDKIATDEAVRASSAAFSWVVFGAGLSMVLRNRGPKTCPYCRSLNGKKVTKSKPLVNAGDEIDPKGGTGPMNFFETKFHTPIHQGCDCYMSAI